MSRPCPNGNEKVTTLSLYHTPSSLLYCCLLYIYLSSLPAHLLLMAVGFTYKLPFATSKRPILRYMHTAVFERMSVSPFEWDVSK